MKITIDRKIYTDSCVSKTIYHLSDKCSINRHLIGECEEWEIQSKNNEEISESFVLDLLNDYKLREIIDIETKDIKTILFAKAFGDLEGLDD